MSQDVKRVYLFREGNATMRDTLGGKGANLAEMTNIGLPVPPGFTITTETCNDYLREGKFPEGLWDQVLAALQDVEKDLGKKLGDPKNPLLFSVRSGSKFSMPGMMDTILNLGLNENTLEGVIAASGNPRFAYDSYRRFIMMFSDVVLAEGREELEKEAYEEILEHVKDARGAHLDTDLDAEGMKEVVDLFLAHFKKHYGSDFPTDPLKQLELSITAVFKSWNNPRAIIYRNKEKIAHDLGTAVNVQAMVFGNMGSDCGTGVAFTRNPATGENRVYGEYLRDAQGEDVVAGVRTPQSIDQLAQEFPEIYKQFEEICKKLEDHYREMQDIEFTIEKERLFILQCRSGKRTGPAAVKIVVDMVRDGFIKEEEAIQRVPPEQLEQLLHPRLINRTGAAPIATGLNAGPGGAVGHAAFDSAAAIRLQEEGKNVILVRRITNPDDLAGMLASKGVLTSEGGRTSHAALVARQYGIPTICGCKELKVDIEARLATVNGRVIREGDTLSINGTTGEVFDVALETEPAAVSGDFATFMSWADKHRKLGVRTNADTPEQAEEAIRFGAEGIGLCRTEHMFLGSERVQLVRDMILAGDEQTRQAALDRLLPQQREDFVGIFRAMENRPVTVRLIDPPLHEFLPRAEEVKTELRRLMDEGAGGAALERTTRLLAAVEDLHEENPMLGLRGCRLSIVLPGIVNMQVAAIIGAACEVKKSGGDPRPEIMIPLVGHVNELTLLKKQLEEVAQATMTAEGVKVDYSFGTMIEIPRAALTAAEIAGEASFFSFGTNDLTQMTYGLSRDDAAKFLPVYIQKGIFKADPTETIDRNGVGRLMQICVDDAKQVNPNIKLGICGEHGGDPASIQLCHELGLTYVSCSPRRVPVARLAAAQSALGSKGPADK
ncbi:MAG: pyruvate, phosphate dikinase [Armatimonadota bacterium]